MTASARARACVREMRSSNCFNLNPTGAKGSTVLVYKGTLSIQYVVDRSKHERKKEIESRIWLAPRTLVCFVRCSCSFRSPDLSTQRQKERRGTEREGQRERERERESLQTPSLPPSSAYLSCLPLLPSRVSRNRKRKKKKKKKKKNKRKRKEKRKKEKRSQANFFFYSTQPTKNE